MDVSLSYVTASSELTLIQRYLTKLKLSAYDKEDCVVQLFRWKRNKFIFKSFWSTRASSSCSKNLAFNVSIFLLKGIEIECKAIKMKKHLKVFSQAAEFHLSSNLWNTRKNEEPRSRRKAQQTAREQFKAETSEVHKLFSLVTVDSDD